VSDLCEQFRPGYYLRECWRHLWAEMSEGIFSGGGGCFPRRAFDILILPTMYKEVPICRGMSSMRGVF